MGRSRARARGGEAAVTATYAYESACEAPSSAPTLAAVGASQEAGASGSASVSTVTADGDGTRARIQVGSYLHDVLVESGMPPDVAIQFAAGIPSLSAGVSAADVDSDPRGSDLLPEQYRVSEADCVEVEYDEDDPRWVCGRPTAELRALCSLHGRSAAGGRAELVGRMLQVMDEGEGEEGDGRPRGEGGERGEGAAEAAMEAEGSEEVRVLWRCSNCLRTDRHAGVDRNIVTCPKCALVACGECAQDGHPRCGHSWR